MYRWIFRALPGPTLLKVIWSLILKAAVVFVLFGFVFPVVNSHFFDNTIAN